MSRDQSRQNSSGRQIQQYDNRNRYDDYDDLFDFPRFSQGRSLMPFTGNFPMGFGRRFDDFGPLAPFNMDFGLDRAFSKEFRQLERNMPRVDVRDEREQYIVHVDLPPNIKSEDVKIDIKNQVLTISSENKYSTTRNANIGKEGEKRRRQKQDQEDAPGDFHITESGQSSFVRSMRLPENTFFNKAKASFENGELIITIPKDTKAIQDKTNIPITFG